MATDSTTTWGYKDLPENPAVAYRRLADQIDFFDKRSKQNQTRYKRLKFVTVLCAASVTASGAFSLPPWFISLLGLSIVVIEGVIQLNTMLQNWLSYRNTCEMLKHEKYLALSGAGPYEKAADSMKLLSERTEEILGTERTSWIAAQEDTKNRLSNGQAGG